MNKFVMIAAMLVLVLAFDVTAIADVSQNVGSGISQGIAQQDQSGDVTASGSVNSAANNSNQCVTPQGFGNTGSPHAQAAVLQYNSRSGDINADGTSLSLLQFNSRSGDIKGDGGSPMTLEPALVGSCGQDVQQSGAAG